MEQRQSSLTGTVSFWLGLVSLLLAFMPLLVAYSTDGQGFSGRAPELGLAFAVPLLLALVALGLGITELVARRGRTRLAVVGVVLAALAIAGAALTLYAIEQSPGL
jgi:hypothetical protein